MHWRYAETRGLTKDDQVAHRATSAIPIAPHRTLFPASESVGQFQSEVQPLGPEVGPVEFGRRPSSPYERSASDRIGNCDTLIAGSICSPGSGHRADPPKRAACEELQAQYSLSPRSCGDNDLVAHEVPCDQTHEAGVERFCAFQFTASTSRGCPFGGRSSYPALCASAGSLKKPPKRVRSGPGRSLSH